MDSKNLVARVTEIFKSSPIIDNAINEQKSPKLRRNKWVKKVYLPPAKDDKSIDYSKPSRIINAAYLQDSTLMSFKEPLSQDKKKYFSEISSVVIPENNLGNIFSHVNVVSITEPDEIKTKITLPNFSVQHIGMSDFGYDEGGNWTTVRAKRSRLSIRKEKIKRRKAEEKNLRNKEIQLKLNKNKRNKKYKRQVVIVEKESSRKEKMTNIEVIRQEKSFASIVMDWDIQGGNYEKLKKELRDKESKKKETETREKEMEKKRKNLEKRKK